VKSCILFLAIVLAAAPAWGEESFSPHKMVGKDGQPDMEKCAICHNPDFSLLQPRSEICLMCHSQNNHSGALRHLEAKPAAVAQFLEHAAKEETKLPLTEEGGIFCGTCHYFHDPAISGETPLASPWLPPTTGLAGAVRDKLQATLTELAQKQGATEPAFTFATKSTTAIRLPVSNGALCHHCHGNMK